MTLPLIHALHQTTRSERRRIINLVKNHNKDTERVREVIAFVRQSGGLEYAQKRMKDYQDQAFEILSAFPANEFRDGLEQLVKFTTERTK